MKRNTELLITMFVFAYLGFMAGRMLTFYAADPMRKEISCQHLQNSILIKLTECGGLVKMTQEGGICNDIPPAFTVDQFEDCNNQIKKLSCDFTDIPNECKVLRIKRNER